MIPGFVTLWPTNKSRMGNPGWGFFVFLLLLRDSCRICWALLLLAQYFKMLICIVLVILGNLKSTRDGELIGLERNTSYDIIQI